MIARIIFEILNKTIVSYEHFSANAQMGLVLDFNRAVTVRFTVSLCVLLEDKLVQCQWITLHTHERHSLHLHEGFVSVF